MISQSIHGVTLQVEYICSKLSWNVHYFVLGSSLNFLPSTLAPRPYVVLTFLYFDATRNPTATAAETKSNNFGTTEPQWQSTSFRDQPFAVLTFLYANVKPYVWLALPNVNVTATEQLPRQATRNDKTNYSRRLNHNDTPRYSQASLA